MASPDAEVDPTDGDGAGSDVGGSDPDTRATGRRWANLPLVLGVAVTVLVIDQLSKWWAVENLDTQTIDLVWTLRLNLTFNRGAAFSFGGEGGFGPYIGVAALVVVGILLWTGQQFSSKVGAVALGLVLGGALGNLADRAFRGDGVFDGAVVDFIDVQWWPVWNVADMGVVIGAILLAIVGMRASD